MSKDPMKMIDEYLERVQVYLPLGSEDTLDEIRTHLIEEAERLGSGEVTIGSTMMAVERFGDPKNVASEYAGTTRRAGLVPAEYTQPLIRILVVLIGISVAFLVGAYVVGYALSGFPEVSNYPLSIPIMILVNLVFVFMIIGGLSTLDKDKLPTDKTLLEGVFGIGTGAFKPKGRLDAMGDVIFGIFGGILVLLPQLTVIFYPVFLPFIPVVAVLSFLNALKGILFVVGGENNLNLIFDAVLSMAWIFFAMVLLNIGFPIQYALQNTNGTWYLIDLRAFFAEYFDFFYPLDIIWGFIVFVIVVVSTWRVIISTMKVPMYLNAGKRLWWKGTWGESMLHRRR
jgi:hypothetical protein